MKTLWQVSTCMLPRPQGATLGDWVYDDMDEALNRFMNEVAASIKYVSDDGPKVGAMASMYQEYVIDRAETEAAFRNYLSGDPAMNILPALVLKEVVGSETSSWLHTLAKIEEKR